MERVCRVCGRSYRGLVCQACHPRGSGARAGLRSRGESLSESGTLTPGAETPAGSGAQAAEGLGETGGPERSSGALRTQGALLGGVDGGGDLAQDGVLFVRGQVEQADEQVVGGR